MQTSFLITATVALAAACTQAWAQDAGQRVEITAPRAAIAERVLEVHRDEAVYDMSSGRLLALATSGDVLTMRYGRHLKRTLRADADGGFVSADGRVQMAFELDGHSVRQVRLTLPADWQ